VFFLSDGLTYSDGDIAAAIAEAVQCRPLRVTIPRGVLPLVALLAEKLKGLSIINSDKIREIRHPFWVCDPAKAMRVLGFVPRVKIKEGAQWTADWYRLHNWL
jgi:nucleoside-diphosphate-sugar epimerase